MVAQSEHRAVWALLRLFDVLVGVVNVPPSQEDVPTDERSNAGRVTDRPRSVTNEGFSKASDVPDTDGELA